MRQPTTKREFRVDQRRTNRTAASLQESVAASDPTGIADWGLICLSRYFLQIFDPSF